MWKHPLPQHHMKPHLDISSQSAGGTPSGAALCARSVPAGGAGFRAFGRILLMDIASLKPIGYPSDCLFDLPLHEPMDNYPIRLVDPFDLSCSLIDDLRVMAIDQYGVAGDGFKVNVVCLIVLFQSCSS